MTKLFLQGVAVTLLIALLPLAIPTSWNLEYEAAFFYGLLSQLIIPFLIFSPTIRKHFANLLNSKKNRRHTLFAVLILPPIILLTVGLLMMISLRCRCSTGGYLFWTGVQWYPSFVLAMGMFNISLFMLNKGLKVKRVFSFNVAFWLGSVLFVACMIWFLPQKRITSLFLGVLHGPVYDDYIPIDWGIILVRLSHLGMGLLLIVTPWHFLTTKKRQWLLPSMAFLSVFALWTFAHTFPSQTIGHSLLQTNLPDQLSGPNYTIHYSKARLRKDFSIDDFKLEATFHVSEIESLLNEKKYPHVEIYLYPSNHEKKLWFGGGSTDIADVFTPSIHIAAESLPHQSLRHELVHALTSDIAFHGLGFHPNMAFTEGLATVLAPRSRTLDLDQSAAEIIKSKRIENVSKLFSPLFWEISGPRAYAVSGSLIQFVKSEFGVEKLKNLYRGANFEDTLGISRERFVEQWLRKLEYVSKESDSQIIAESLFRYPGILNSECPHSKAVFWEGNKADFFDKFMGFPDIANSKDMYEFEQFKNQNHVEYLLKIWKIDLRKELSKKSKDISKLTLLLERLVRAKSWPPKSIEDIEITIIESDLLKYIGKKEQSAQRLNELREISEKTNLGSANLRKIFARIYLEQLDSNDEATEWRYALSSLNDTTPRLDPTEKPWIIQYLILKNSKHSLSQSYLDSLFKTSIPDDVISTFKLEFYKNIAEQMMRNKEFRKAQDVLQMALPFSPKGGKEYIDQEIRRAAFFESNKT